MDMQTLEQFNYGKYQMSEDGILSTITDSEGNPQLKVVFPQMIVPTAVIHNITTENERVKLEFYRGKEWRQVIVDKGIIANKNKIIELSNKGIAVNSINSGILVNYLSVMENINYDIMDKCLETSQLGWYKNSFLPYDNTIMLSDIGGINIDQFRANGTFEKWLEATNIARNAHRYFRIVLASEFASPLLKITGTLGAITHLWGSTGTGKTVALMCGASVWGLPANDDGIITTFNSTKVGFELLCNYLQNLPLNVDELETSNKANNDDIVYLITEGKGKLRGKTNGEIANIGKWKLWGISTGEHPITNNNSKGGALNRIINLQTSHTLIDKIENVNDVCTIWRNNYGIAGKKFIEHIKTLNKDELISKYNNYLQQFLKIGGTGKQCMAGAMLMLADELANDCIFKDDLKLTIDDFRGIILSESEVSRSERYYDQLFDWVASNERHFNKTENVDQWGKIEIDEQTKEIKQIKVIKSVLDNQFFRDVNSTAIYCEWKKAGYIECDEMRYTKQLRMNNIKSQGIFIYPKKEPNTIDNKEQLVDKPELTPVDNYELPF